MSFDAKKVMIIGEGISGKGAATALTAVGVEWFFYSDEKDFEREIDLIVASPGIPVTDRVFALAKQKKLAIIGELELGFLLCDKPIIAITGTNGKTTITQLIGKILSCDKRIPLVSGNIGISFAECAVKGGFDIAVVEVSSFQLETIKKFCPDIAIISNITEDHLDRHKTMASYTKAKLNIVKNQNEQNHLILPASLQKITKSAKIKSQITYIDDSFQNYANSIPNTKSCGKADANKKKLSKSSTGSKKSNENEDSIPIVLSNAPANARCFAEENKIFFDGQMVAYVDGIRIKGAHNLSNALLAIAACKILGCDDRAIRLGLKLFESAEFRNKLILEFGAKKYFNDSKGTNIDACLCACRSMNGSTCLIAGGSDKGYDFDALFSSLPSQIVKVFLVGETTQKMQKSAKKAGFLAIEVFSSIREATQAASKLEVDNVLLSPATASFDSYVNYQERGRDFDNIVKEIAQGSPQ